MCFFAMQNLVFSTLISHASRTRHAVFLFRPDKVFRPLSNRNYFFKKFFCTALFCRSSSCFIKPVDLFKALSGDALSPGYRTLYLRIEQETTAGRRPLTAQKRDAAPAKHVCRHIRPRNRSYKSASVEIIPPCHHVCTAPYQPS